MRPYIDEIIRRHSSMSDLVRDGYKLLSSLAMKQQRLFIFGRREKPSEHRGDYVIFYLVAEPVNGRGFRLTFNVTISGTDMAVEQSHHPNQEAMDNYILQLADSIFVNNIKTSGGSNVSAEYTVSLSWVKEEYSNVRRNPYDFPADEVLSIRKSILHCLAKAKYAGIKTVSPSELYAEVCSDVDIHEAELRYLLQRRPPWIEQGPNRYRITVDGLEAYDNMIRRGDEIKVQPDKVIKIRDFAFMHDEKLKSIIGRDYPEVQKCIDGAAYKATVVVAGSLIEALLLDVLERNESGARASGHAPPGKVSNWAFDKMIKVAEDIGLISDVSSRLSDVVRDYRNLIHPSIQRKKQYIVDEEEAIISQSVLEKIIKELKLAASTLPPEIP